MEPVIGGKVEKYRSDGWSVVSVRELELGDLFRMTETGEGSVWYMSISQPFKDDVGNWNILAARYPDDVRIQ